MENVQKIFAIELLMATHALHMRRKVIMIEIGFIELTLIENVSCSLIRLSKFLLIWEHCTRSVLQ